MQRPQYSPRENQPTKKELFRYKHEAQQDQHGASCVDPPVHLRNATIVSPPMRFALT